VGQDKADHGCDLYFCKSEYFSKRAGQTKSVRQAADLPVGQISATRGLPAT
jgi:hypothetical protein